MRDRTTRIKTLIIGLFLSVGFVGFIMRAEPTKAANDEILTALASYKSWDRITKEPFKVKSIQNAGINDIKIVGTFKIDRSAFGWGVIVDGISGPGIKKPDTDLVTILTNTGKAIASVFDGKDKPAAKEPPKVEPKAVSIDPRIKDLVDADNHNTTIGDVYANEKAQTNIYYNQPNFPVGSMIVREKYSLLGTVPDTVIAMVKRDAGFNAASGDWEFFVFDGRDLTLQSRETIGSCATCHARAKDTDWTFRTYMNFSR